MNTHKEIEHKFTVISFEWKDDSHGVLFRQGYLSIDPERSVRVRLEGDNGKITIKGRKAGSAGDEFEYDIPQHDAEYILKYLCIKPIIIKKRYFVTYEEFTWSIDEFMEDNKGLYIAEVELNHADQKFSKPTWAGKEVTDNHLYKNVNLVTYPFSKWKDVEKE